MYVSISFMAAARSMTEKPNVLPGFKTSRTQSRGKAAENIKGIYIDQPRYSDYSFTN